MICVLEVGPVRLCWLVESLIWSLGNISNNSGLLDILRTDVIIDIADRTLFADNRRGLDVKLRIAFWCSFIGSGHIGSILVESHIDFPSDYILGSLGLLLHLLNLLFDIVIIWQGHTKIQ